MTRWLAMLALVASCGPTSEATEVPYILNNQGQQNDITVLNAVGPGTYTLRPDRTIIVDTTVKSRVIAGSPYTDGLNAQAVACTKAKLTGTPFVSITGEGDSITQGTSGGSYRVGINQQLIDTYGSAMPIEWEGSGLIAGDPEPFPLQYSCGVAGATTLSLNSNVPSLFGPTHRMPDVIVIQAGTNDAAGSIDAATYHTRMKSLIQSLHTQCPSAKIAVAYVPENPNNPTADAFVTQYNADLPTIWNESESELGITLYRATGVAGLVSADMGTGPDSIHPTAAGNLKIAAVLGPAVLAAVAATGKV